MAAWKVIKIIITCLITSVLITLLDRVTELLSMHGHENLKLPTEARVPKEIPQAIPYLILDRYASLFHVYALTIRM